MWEMMQESISSQVNGTNMFGGWMEVLFSVYHISDVFFLLFLFCFFFLLLFFWFVTNCINHTEKEWKKTSGMSKGDCVVFNHRFFLLLLFLYSQIKMMMKMRQERS